MKILCFGDSNTYGFDPRSYYGSQYAAADLWVNLLAEKLGCEVINEGQNGREIPYREADLLQFDKILSQCQSNDLLIIMLGTNDILRGNPVDTVNIRMQNFLKRMNWERRNIYLIGPPPMQRGEWVSDQSLVNAAIRLNYTYKDIAEDLRVHFVDAADWNVALAFDGVHFTEAGHRAFAEGLVDYLKLGEFDI